MHLILLVLLTMVAPAQNRSHDAILAHALQHTRVPSSGGHTVALASGETNARDGQAAAAATTSGRLREETLKSAALGRTMKYRVLVPEGYEASLERYPVLYLLHGLGGNYRDWTMRSNLAEYSRTLPLIIVMPDGENQWYTNAADGSAKFEDYILTDLQADVVQKYRTIHSRYGRAIAGLSMGGYGSLKMALRRPALFSVVGSFSGAFAVTSGEIEKLVEAPEAERIGRIFGPAGSATRKENDLLALAGAVKPAAAPYIYIDCGTGDRSLIGANREVIAALNQAGAAYEYHEVGGAHTWDYWDRRIREFLPILLKRMTND